MEYAILKPYSGDNYLKNNFFNSPFSLLKSELLRENITLDTYDRESKTAKCFISFNHSCKIYEKYKRKINILFLWEPSIVEPEQYQEKILKKYDFIISFNKDFSAPVTHHFAYWPQMQDYSKLLKDELNPFHTRKDACIVCANKFSYIKGELYSLRRKWIRESSEQNNFSLDLYGHGWNQNNLSKIKGHLLSIRRAVSNHNFSPKNMMEFITPSKEYLKSYLGTIDDKQRKVSEYKFSICIENQANYVSEKFFDCLAAGNIPLYYGPNLDKYDIPREIYIDLKEYSPQNIGEFLKNYTSEDHSIFIKKLKNFITSDGFQLKWKAESSIKNMGALLCRLIKQS